MPTVYIRTAGAFGIVKGVLLALATGLLDITFWKALIIAVVAALIGFAGSLVAAWYTIRESRLNRQLVQDVKRKLGADQRAGDGTGG